MGDLVSEDKYDDVYIGNSLLEGTANFLSPLIGYREAEGEEIEYEGLKPRDIGGLYKEKPGNGKGGKDKEKKGEGDDRGGKFSIENIEKIILGDSYNNGGDIYKNNGDVNIKGDTNYSSNGDFNLNYGDGDFSVNIDKDEENVEGDKEEIGGDKVYGNKWTDKEEYILEKCYIEGDLTAKEVAEYLPGRTVSAVYSKASRYENNIENEGNNAILQNINADGDIKIDLEQIFKGEEDEEGSVLPTIEYEQGEEILEDPEKIETYIEKVSNYGHDDLKDDLGKDSPFGKREKDALEGFFKKYEEDFDKDKAANKAYVSLGQSAIQKMIKEHEEEDVDLEEEYGVSIDDLKSYRASLVSLHRKDQGVKKIEYEEVDPNELVEYDTREKIKDHIDEEYKEGKIPDDAYKKLTGYLEK